MDIDYTNNNLCFSIRFEDHIEAMKAGSIGKNLWNFALTNGIPIKRNHDLPYNCYGIFRQYPRYLKGFKGIGCVEYDPVKLNSLVLAHELRHAQQTQLPLDIVLPRNPNEYIVLNRFIEADARAVHFGSALQSMDNLGRDHYYASRIKTIISSKERKIYEDSLERVSTICASPDLLNQAMRHAFNVAIIQCTGAAPYNHLIQARLQQSAVHQKTSLINVFACAASWSRNMAISLDLRILPVFDKPSMDSDYPKELANALGGLGTGVPGNYLMETHGPAWDSEFYTRTCSQTLEKTASDIECRIRKGLSI